MFRYDILIFLNNGPSVDALKKKGHIDKFSQIHTSLYSLSTPNL